MLKILACLLMVFDHIGFVFFPGALWIRIVGRLAFPLFAWYVAIGFERTRSPARYLGRLLIWAFVAQIPFALTFFGASPEEPLSFLRGLNVLFTFSLALMALWLLKSSRNQSWLLRLFSWTGTLALVAVGLLINADYGAYGVLLVVLLHLTRNSKGWALLLVGGLTFAATRLMPMHPIQIYSMLALPLLWIPLPDPRPGRWKWVFYAFYPAHILLLWVLSGVL